MHVFCPHCSTEMLVPGPGQFSCGKCSEVFQVAAPIAKHVSEETVAKKKRHSEFIGAGCLVQAIGIVLLFFFPIGTLIGVVLLIYGSGLAIKWRCGHCG